VNARAVERPVKTCTCCSPARSVYRTALGWCHTDYTPAVRDLRPVHLTDIGGHVRCGASKNLGAGSLRETDDVSAVTCARCRRCARLNARAADDVLAAPHLASRATVEGIAGVLMRDCGFCRAQGSPCERHQFDAERVVAYLTEGR